MWVVHFFIMSFEVSSVRFWWCPLYLLLPFLFIIFERFFWCLFLYVCMCDQRLSPAPHTLSFSTELHPQLLVLIPLTFFLWVGAGTLCVKVHIHMHMWVCVGAKGQPQMSFLRSHTPCFERQVSLSLAWIPLGGIHWLPNRFAGSNCPHWIFKHVIVPELWGSNSGSNACGPSSLLIEPSPQPL